MANSRIIILSFMLLIGIGFLGWYMVKPEAKKQRDSVALSKSPDAIIKGLTVVKYNRDGNRASRLFTQVMTHIPHQNTSIMQQPKITSFNPKQPPWVITAKKGIAVHGSEKIQFSENVIIHQAAIDKIKSSTLYTDELFFYPDKQLATTTKAVTFEQPGLTVKSIGMNAYLNQKRIRLLSKAWGRYEPTITS
jgi:lipopolysaccharide export system protein LptC